MNTDLLFKGFCRLRIIYPDSSEVQCITTLNPTELSKMNLNYVDGFVDVTTRREIPSELLTTQRVEIEEGTNLTLSKLDALFQNAIKNTWRKI